MKEKTNESVYKELIGILVIVGGFAVAKSKGPDSFQFQYEYKLGLIKWHFEMIVMNINMILNSN